MQRKFILSIDGGGIRGILPAAALVKLEQLTGRPARETFSMVAGTSTGALIAAAVAAGVPAPRILEIYLERTREIFSPGAPWNTMKRAATGNMYSTQKLYGVVAGALGGARAWSVNDCPIDLLITAKRVSDGKPWYFVRDKAANARTTGRFPLVDCVTASAAAPTYFSPWTIPEIGALADGGVGVTGNPVYQACVEAFYYTGEYSPQDTTIVSFGTGRFISEQHPRTLWGWLGWVLDEMFRSPGEQQTELVRRHFPEIEFHRLEPEIPKDIPMDDVGSIPQLQQYAQHFAEGVDWSTISGIEIREKVSN